jgi:signal transduction histidine kinase/CheY-like chemotaxis protein
MGTPDAVCADGPAPAAYLHAVRRLETIIVEDVETDSRVHQDGAALLQEGTRAMLEVPLQHGGKHTGVLFFHAPEPRRWSNHEITTLREVARDLTVAIQRASDQEARGRAQAALETSEKRLRLALAAGHMSCWECNLVTGTIAYTPAPGSAQAASPGTLEELSALLHEQDRAHVLEAFRRARGEGGTFHVEYRLAPPGGPYQWFETRAEAHRGHTGEWSHLIGVSSDITERKQAEEALRHRQKLEGLGVLAGGVAHDFNNLLTGILGNATLAAELVDSDHPAHVLVEDVCLAGERAAELTQQLLAYAGKGRYVLAPLDVSTLVQDTCRLIQLSIPKKTSLSFDLAAGLPHIEADRGQLQQIVMNLVLNAGEAVADRENPVIRVTTGVAEIDEARLRRMAPVGAAEPGRYVALTVEDNGSGIDEATKARIFDPFFTTKSTGRGLGLAAVHGIVRAHRGGLIVSSAPRSGTVFQVFFPVAKAGAAGETSGAAATELRGVVLVVDQEAHARQTAADILSGAGYHVVVAEDGGVALQALRETADIVAVLMDSALAHGHFARTVRELRPEIPVVLSSSSRDGDAAPSATFVRKPFSSAALLSRIGALTTTAIAAAASAGEALSDS